MPVHALLILICLLTNFMQIKIKNIFGNRMLAGRKCPDLTNLKSLLLFFGISMLTNPNKNFSMCV